MGFYFINKPVSINRSIKVMTTSAINFSIFL